MAMCNAAGLQGGGGLCAASDYLVTEWSTLPGAVRSAENGVNSTKDMDVRERERGSLEVAMPRGGDKLQELGWWTCRSG